MSKLKFILLVVFGIVVILSGSLIQASKEKRERLEMTSMTYQEIAARDQEARSILRSAAAPAELRLPTLSFNGMTRKSLEEFAAEMWQSTQRLEVTVARLESRVEYLTETKDSALEALEKLANPPQKSLSWTDIGDKIVSWIVQLIGALTAIYGAYNAGRKSIQ